ncbi:DUF2164 domain-containing protein [Paenibacillus sp. FSL W8-1187]|uniref:DUF2164 domain-containing protein n=1 Tax=Paenibacillus pasadenensis TaxID=217090 RepID=A0A2N5N4A5_9BACL|nr:MULTISPECIES: DUF2164 domain-containing protein [Paenibacillus]PLT45177.1 hypothetical protein B8V81_3608 [Paenibacillus pasadenensis]QGG55569.1 DUF2164 family protein [Paenibacillus sp. B01]
MMPIKLPLEQKKELAEQLRDFADRELDLPLGTIGAEALLDHMIAALAPHLYNKGVEDALKLLGQRMLQVEDDLHALKRTIR